MFQSGVLDVMGDVVEGVLGAVCGLLAVLAVVWWARQRGEHG
jgi:hypothetical protein